MGSSTGEYRSRLSLLAGSHLQGVPPTLQVSAPCRDTPTQVLPCPYFMYRHTPLCVVCTYNLRANSMLCQYCNHPSGRLRTVLHQHHSNSVCAAACGSMHVSHCMLVACSRMHTAPAVGVPQAGSTHTNTCLSFPLLACAACLCNLRQHTCLCGMTQSYPLTHLHLWHDTISSLNTPASVA